MIAEKHAQTFKAKSTGTYSLMTFCDMVRFFNAFPFERVWYYSSIDKWYFKTEKHTQTCRAKSTRTGSFMKFHGMWQFFKPYGSLILS